MNKEELEKEAEKYFKSICGDYNEEYERTGKRHYFVGFDIKNGYLAGAEPREKRIVELEAENEQIKNSDTLCKLIGEQKRKIADLEEQIEKMKCGGNCKHLYHVNTGGCYDAKCDLTYCDCTNCKDEWELRR